MSVVRPTVILADDHELFLSTAAAELRGVFDVVATATTGQGLIEAAQRHEPDVLVVDISMPGMSGIEAVRRLVKAGCRSAIVMLTTNDDPDLVELALDAGALGYVVKDRMANDLPRAIEAARARRTFISPIRPHGHSAQS